MIAIQLADGTRIVADNAEDIIEAWNGAFMNQVIEPADFRQAIADRARLWSATEIRIDGSADEFLAECARARLIEIVEVTSLGNVTIGRFTTSKG